MSPTGKINLWFPSDQTWVIPVLDVSGAIPACAHAAQVGGHGAVWSVGAREEDLPDLMQAQVGDWIVEGTDHHRERFPDADFRARFRVDPEDLRLHAEEFRKRAGEQHFFAGHQDGDAYHQEMRAARQLMTFSTACMQLADRGELALQEARSGQVPTVEQPTGRDRQTILQESLRKMQQAFAGELPLSVWITRTVRQEFPADMVQKVMQEISEHGGDHGGPVAFDSVARHRDTALDALLRSGSAYTLGIPIEDSLSQKQWESRGIYASEAMVHVVHRLLNAGENAHETEGAQMPFNQDGFFDAAVDTRGLAAESGQHRRKLSDLNQG
jgi:hypothetical protein